MKLDLTHCFCCYDILLCNGIARIYDCGPGLLIANANCNWCVSWVKCVKFNVPLYTHNRSFCGRVFPANHLAMVLTKQTYNTKDKHTHTQLNQTNHGSVASYDIQPGNNRVCSNKKHSLRSQHWACWTVVTLSQHVQYTLYITMCGFSDCGVLGLPGPSMATPMLLCYRWQLQFNKIIMLISIHTDSSSTIGRDIHNSSHNIISFYGDVIIIWPTAVVVTSSVCVHRQEIAY